MIRPTLLPLFVALLTAILASPASAGKRTPTTSKESLRTSKETLLDPTAPTKIPEETRDGKEPIPVETIYAYGNMIVITDDCEADEVRVLTDGIENTYDSSDLKKIYVDLTGSNNWFRFVAGASTNQLIHDRQIFIEGSSDFDTIDLSLSSNEVGFGDLTIQAQVLFDVATGHGSDTLGLLVDKVGSSGHLVVNGDLGEDDDYFTSGVYGDLSGTLGLHIGGGANEYVDFCDVLFSCNVLPTGNLNVFCHGGYDYDSMKCRYRGIVEGNATFYVYGNDFYEFEPLPTYFGDFTSEDRWHLLELNAEEGDSIAMDILLEEGSNGTVNAMVEDGLGDDELTLQVYQEAGADVQLEAALSGGYGYDWWYATGHEGEPGEFVEIDGVESFDPSLRID